MNFNNYEERKYTYNQPRASVRTPTFNTDGFQAKSEQ